MDFLFLVGTLVVIAAFAVFIIYNVDLEMAEELVRIFYPEKVVEKQVATLIDVDALDVKSLPLQHNDDTLSINHCFGKIIPNPFQWMEDVKSARVAAWMKEQTKFSNQYLNSMETYQQAIQKAITESSTYELIEPPFHLNGKYFFMKKSNPDQSQYALYCTSDLFQEGKLIFDPNLLHHELNSLEMNNTHPVYHSHLYVLGTWISDDGSKLAYGYTSDLASDDMTIRVRDISRDVELVRDKIEGCLASNTCVTWLEGRTGFFYTKQVMVDSRRPVPLVSWKVFFHHIGQTADHDFAVYETTPIEINSVSINTIKSSDGHYLLIELFSHKCELSCNSSFRNVINESDSQVYHYVGNKVYLFDLSKFDAQTKETIGQCYKLIDSSSYRFEYISNIEDEFWFRTNYHANNFRVVRVTLPLDFTTYDLQNSTDYNELNEEMNRAWTECLEWIPEHKCGGYLESAGIAAHTVLVLKYQCNMSHEVLLYDLTEALAEESQIPVADLPHPPYGTITGPNCNFYSSEIFYHFSDFSDPGSIYRAVIVRDPYSGSIEISFDQLKTGSVRHIDPFEFEVTQEMCSHHSRLSLNKSRDTIPCLVFRKRPALQHAQAQAQAAQGHASASVGDGTEGGPCLVLVPSGFGEPVIPKFCLPLLTFVKHFNGTIVLPSLHNLAEQQDMYSRHSTATYVGGTTNRRSAAASPRGGSATGGGGSGRRGPAMPKRDQQVTVDRLYSVLKHLVERKFTTFDKIGVYGGCDGGLTIAACMTQHPSSFGAAVIEDGIFDLLKYQLYNHELSAASHSASPGGASGEDATLPSRASTSGSHVKFARDVTDDQSNDTSLWYDEYGVSTESSDDLHRLLSLSPLHQVKGMRQVTHCPAIWLLASPIESTNRVSCIHSMKLMAELQNYFYKKDFKKRPLLISIDDPQVNDPDDTPSGATASAARARSVSSSFSAAQSSSALSSDKRVRELVRDIFDNRMTHSKENICIVSSTEKIAAIIAFFAYNLQLSWSDAADPFATGSGAAASKDKHI